MLERNEIQKKAYDRLYKGELTDLPNQSFRNFLLAVCIAIIFGVGVGIITNWLLSI